MEVGKNHEGQVEKRSEEVHEEHDKDLQEYQKIGHVISALDPPVHPQREYKSPYLNLTTNLNGNLEDNHNRAHQDNSVATTQQHSAERVINRTTSNTATEYDEFEALSEGSAHRAPEQSWSSQDNTEEEITEDSEEETDKKNVEDLRASLTSIKNYRAWKKSSSLSLKKRFQEQVEAIGSTDDDLEDTAAVPRGGNSAKTTYSSESEPEVFTSDNYRTHNSSNLSPLDNCEEVEAIFRKNALLRAARESMHERIVTPRKKVEIIDLTGSDDISDKGEGETTTSAYSTSSDSAIGD